MRAMLAMVGLFVMIVAMGTANAEIVDSKGNVGWDSSIVLDSDNCPHISYHDATTNNMKYAYKDTSGFWHIETVDRSGEVGWVISSHPSIALDSDGYPHISYYDAINDDLKHAWKDDYGWHIETVDSEGDVGDESSIALFYDEVHIAYYDYTNKDLKWAYKARGSDWYIETVEESGVGQEIVGLDPSIVLDSSGNPYISYTYCDLEARIANVKFAYFMGPGNWHIETVDVGMKSSIALDSDGRPHISYQGYEGSEPVVKYATFTAPGSWHIETVGVGELEVYSTSLTLDSNNNPHIVWAEEVAEHDVLKYAYKDSSGWHIEAVDYGDTPSIAVDSYGIPHISYYDYTNGDLKYTTKQPTIVNLQGGITDLDGNPVTTASMRVTIKDAGGNVVYSEVINDALENSKFDILLGATQSLTLWQGAAYNLVIDVDVDSASFVSADVTFGDNQPAGDIIVFYP